MRQEPIQDITTKQYRQLIISFREWLRDSLYAKATIYGMPNRITEFLYYLETEGITSIKEADVTSVNSFFESLFYKKNRRRAGGLSPGSINKYTQALKKFSFYLEKTKQINLPVQLRYEKVEIKKEKVLSIEEVKALFSATEKEDPISRRDQAMIVCLYSLGLRKSELIRLDVEDVLLEKEQVYIKSQENKETKTARERYIPLTQYSRQILENYIFLARPLLLKDGTSSALFISERKKRISPELIPYRLKILQEQSEHPELKNKNLHAHLLRHSLGKHLLSGGLSISDIAMILGHTSTNTTQRYTQVEGEP